MVELRAENKEYFEKKSIPQQDKSITDVVFIMHGIRDYGGWTRKFRAQIEELSGNFKVVTPSYDYFPMGDFLIFPRRQKNVRWFMDKFAEFYAQYRDAKFSFVGHSNGTYIIASALQSYPTLRMHRIALAGSVIRRDYEWDNLVQQGRVYQLRNDMAAFD